MSGIFLFYEFTITSGLNIFYLHLETGLVTSKKYWRVSSKGPFLKEVILWNPYENSNERRKIEFSKSFKNFFFRAS